ncbi:MinD/ParA family ATP-binding protein [Frankia gtarii]|uniref:MinD/ParA family ATP-binding protein n=1 Tax=Frankia gtarii TaxID=2950102 RepID=UPI0021C05FD4|nr:hypothetical protein [Frankia gtarii]
MIIAVGSLKGSPGATTLALALADRWPADGGEPLVVEADPAGGDLGARFGLAAGRGLVSLAAAGRRGGQPRPLAEHVQQLPGGLQVLPAPAGAEHARQVLGELGGGGWSLLWAAAQAESRPLIVDCGRLTPAAPALRAADVLLLVVRPRDDELAHLAARMHVVQGWALPAWYVVVVAEPGRTPDYRVRDITRVLGPRVLGPLPYDTAAAGVLAGRRQSRSGISRTRLGRTVTQMAGSLAASVPAEPAPPGPPGPPGPPVAPPGGDGRAALPPTRTGVR